MTDKCARRAPLGQPRSVARLKAVQALYDWDLSDSPVDAVLEDFLRHGLGARVSVPAASRDDGEEETETVLADADATLFSAIVRGVPAEASRLDDLVAGALSAGWPSERLESVLRAILRAGAFELAFMSETPARVVISEYVDVAHAFYSGPEPKLTNAVLDRIAQVVREGELDRHAPAR